MTTDRRADDMGQIDREQWDALGNPAGSWEEVGAMAERNTAALAASPSVTEPETPAAQSTGTLSWAMVEAEKVYPGHTHHDRILRSAFESGWSAAKHAIEAEAAALAARPALDVERLRLVIRDLTDEHGWPKSAVGFDPFIDAIAVEYSRLASLPTEPEAGE